jgi:histone H3/H4
MLTEIGTIQYVYIITKFKYVKCFTYSMITARTQVKEILKDSGIGADKISNDFLPRLDEKVKELIVNAAKRAKENCRTTVMGRDV